MRDSYFYLEDLHPNADWAAKQTSTDNAWGSVLSIVGIVAAVLAGVMLAAAPATAVAAVQAAAVMVTDDAGVPVAGATVVFTNAAGNTDEVHTTRAGIAFAPSAFAPVSIRVTAAGYQTASLRISSWPARIMLARNLKTVGVIRVATNSPHDLHLLPVAGSYMDRASVRSSSALTSDALLRTLPGFDHTRSNAAFTNYGQLRVSFNGAGNDRGLVLVDGVPAQDGFGGQIDWMAYPPGLVERAEILRGAGSALYGAGAVGGVLQLYTFGPTIAPVPPPDGIISYAAGGHGTNIADLAFRTPVASDAAMSFYTNRWRATYFDLPPGFTSAVDHPADSRSDATQARFSFGGNGSAAEVGVLHAYDYQDEGRPNYNQTRSFTQFDGTFSRAKEQSLFSLTGYARTAAVTNVADQYPTAPGVMRYTQDVPTNEGGVSASWLVASGGNDFQARLDGRSVSGATYQYFRSGKLQNSGAGSRWLEGFALQETLRRPKFEALFGARIDSVSFFGGSLVSSVKGKYVATYPAERDDAAVSPRAALRYDLTRTLSLRLSDGAGFRPPYLNELVRGFQIGKTLYAPNINLVPERSSTQSAGLDALLGQGRLSLDIFSTKVNDAIAFETITPILQRRANIARTQTDGATLEYDASVSACVRAHAAATTQYARVTDGPAAIIGKRLQFVPDRSADIGFDGTSGRVGLGADVAFVGQTYADGLNIEPLNSVLLAGFRVMAPVGSASVVSLSAENATDRVYLSSVDRLGPPAIYTLRWQIFFGPGGGASAYLSCR